MRKTFSRGLVAAALSVMVVSASPTAGAWPEPLTPAQQKFIDDAKAAGVPGNDDAVFNDGIQACNYLNTGMSKDVVISTVMMSQKMQRPQAVTLVNIAQDELCATFVKKRRY